MLHLDTASRSVVDGDPRLVVDAAECLSLGLQTRRARPQKVFSGDHHGPAWRRPLRARATPSINGLLKCDYVPELHLRLASPPQLYRLE